MRFKCINKSFTFRTFEHRSDSDYPSAAQNCNPWHARPYQVDSGLHLGPPRRARRAAVAAPPRRLPGAEQVEALDRRTLAFPAGVEQRWPNVRLQIILMLKA